MNVEFQIHGVLSSGQKTWKQEDKDYYAQFYSDQAEDVLMTVEIVNRPHGVSAYYNYLRNNNILSARVGSYFGMTMRIDGAFCRDVKSIYMILDNLFNKMIVGSLLVPKGDKYEYAIDSFAAQNDLLPLRVQRVNGSGEQNRDHGTGAGVVGRAEGNKRIFRDRNIPDLWGRLRQPCVCG